MITIVEQEGDSFAKRAEMYNKKRPKLISLVEENLRAYRALADRFDYLSTELQNANTTIASVFPERVEMHDDDDDNSPPITAFGSGLRKSETLKEIDKLQKEIFALQRVKEFMKGSYENDIANYSEIENPLTKFQERVFRLKTDTDDLQEHIRILEDDKAILVDGTSTLTNKLRSLEEELNRVRELNKNIENENRQLKAYFTEARCSLDNSSERLHSVQPDEDLESIELIHGEKCSTYGLKTPEKHDYDGIFFTEYNLLIRNFKDAKKKINDLERKNQETLFEKSAEMTELKGIVAKRDVTIWCLVQKLKVLQENFDVNEKFHEENNPKMILMNQPQIASPIKDKLWMSVDLLLDDNLNFLFKFNTSLHQIEKFKIAFNDLQGEISKLKGEKEGSAISDIINSHLRSIYKHLREIQTDISIWMKHSSLLKDELQDRYSALCKIEGEITKASNADSHETAEFQGEVLNMKQEFYKVRDALRAGLENVNNLKQEIEKTFTRLDQDFEDNGQTNNNQTQMRNSIRQARSVSLMTFIFGAKPKKRTSLLSTINHQRKQDHL